MHGIGVKPFFACAWVTWREKLAQIKKYHSAKRYAKCVLKTGMDGVVYL
jgi:hypothetical protein